MNRGLLLVLVTALAISTGCASTGPRSALAKGTSAEPGLRHVVLFKFKDAATPEQVRSIEEAFCALEDKVEVIQDFEWGADVGVEGLDQGFTHCFIVTFADEAGRDAYLPHPEHKAFGKLLGPHLDKVLVIDFKPQR